MIPVEFNLGEDAYLGLVISQKLIAWPQKKDWDPIVFNLEEKAENIDICFISDGEFDNKMKNIIREIDSRNWRAISEIYFSAASERISKALQ